MMNVPAVLVFMLILLMFGRLRIYLRTGLRGELITIVGGLILAAGVMTNSDWLALAGFVITNGGLIILATLGTGWRVTSRLVRADKCKRNLEV